ncbi:adenosylcobinamide amidohydrolase [uncultured Robinsoniella sp.]|uniref:adenosylcobinamide amidohydrolase n=1 Tax=uncultured Robinsoniella sp. TaxID=904190 RepID=UPI00374E7896
MQERNRSAQRGGTQLLQAAESKMLLAKLSTGDEVHRYKKAIVIGFTGKRRVLSTAPHNGGYRENLTAVFNQDGTVGAGIACTLKAPTYAEHMALIAKEIGLDPETACGISTAAQMENVSVKSETYREVTVTAIVTGGIETNGGRVGDPADWHEIGGSSVHTMKLGTINIMLHFNVDLSKGAIARALVTCTEAKTAAIQELIAPSRYSRGLATGSGTDGTIIIANRDSEICLTNAGKHAKLGELIGKAVIAAVKEALFLQSGLCPECQHHVLKRMDRFGITEDLLWEDCQRDSQSPLDRARFSVKLDQLAVQGKMVVYTSLYAHLLDQLDWEMITAEEAYESGIQLLNLMGMHSALGEVPDGAEECIASMIKLYREGLRDILAGEGIKENTNTCMCKEEE